MSTVVKGYRCWQCGSELMELRLPVSRRDECESCRAEVHVCRQCEYYDSRVAGACREDRAEDVFDKTRSNFCDYFKPNAEAFEAGSAEQSQAARSQAEALFGGSDSGEEGHDQRSSGGLKSSPEDELKRLFGEDSPDN